ncbi:MAG: acyl carrier protein [Acidimicrobiia bacterium]
MDRETIVSQVRSAVIEVLDIDPERVTLDARFAEDLEADSLALVELVMAFEDEFNITVPEDELDAVKTVGDAVDMVARHTA